MAMKMGSIRGMKEDALEKKLNELQMDIVTGEGQGTKLGAIRLSMARIRTYLHQLKAGLSPEPKKTAKRPVAATAKVVAGEKKEKKSLNTTKK